MSKGREIFPNVFGESSTKTKAICKESFLGSQRLCLNFCTIYLKLISMNSLLNDYLENTCELVLSRQADVRFFENWALNSSTRTGPAALPFHMNLDSPSLKSSNISVHHGAFIYIQSLQCHAIIIYILVLTYQNHTHDLLRQHELLQVPSSFELLDID